MRTPPNISLRSRHVAAQNSAASHDEQAEEAQVSLLSEILQNSFKIGIFFLVRFQRTSCFYQKVCQKTREGKAKGPN